MTRINARLVDPSQPLGLVHRYFVMERSPTAIKALDGLRGIAILLVLGRHAVRAFMGRSAELLPIGSWDLSIPLQNGWMGVDLFFVLSGFLISHHILRRWGEGFRWADVRSYLLKRVLRIAPAYYAFLIIVASGCLPFYRVDPNRLGERVVYHLLFLQDYFGSDIVVAFWSLGVEEKFYLLAPLLLIPLLKMRSVGRITLVLTILFLLPLLMRAWTYAQQPQITTYEHCFKALRSPAHLCFDSLLVGALVAFLVRHRDRLALLNRSWFPKVMLWSGTFVVAALLFPYPLLASVGWFNVTALFSLLALGFGAILLALVLDQKLCGRVFESRFLFFFSKISYSLYLVHMVFLGITLTMVDAVLDPWTFAPAVRFLAFVLLFCVLSVTWSLALHYAVEKPFLMLKDRV